MPPLAVIPLEFSPKHEGKKIACIAANFESPFGEENQISDKEMMEYEVVHNNNQEIVKPTLAKKVKLDTYFSATALCIRRK